MRRHTPNEAEQVFLGVLLSDDDLEKAGADLSPETAAALGIPRVSPSILKQLENSATDTIGTEGQSPDEPAPETTPPPDAEAEAQAEAGVADPGQGGFEEQDVPPGEEDPGPPLPSRLTHGKLFSSKRSHPLQILEVLATRYRDRWVDWEPETLMWALRRDFGPVGELTRSKIGALKLAVSSDIPWQDWDVFEDCGQAWNDTLPIIGSFQPLSPMQIAFTVQILRDIRPEDEFSNEVKAYMAALLHDHGFLVAPEEYFGPAQELLVFPPESYSVQGEVAKAWEKARDADPDEIHWDETNPRDIHVLKLATVKRYLDERAGLREELPGSRVTASPTPPMPS